MLTLVSRVHVANVNWQTGVVTYTPIHTRVLERPDLAGGFTTSCKLHDARLRRTPNSVNIDTFNRSVCSDTLFKRVRMCTAEKTRRNRSRVSFLCLRLLHFLIPPRRNATRRDFFISNMLIFDCAKSMDTKDCV